MRAAILVEQGRDLVLDEVELPERLAAGQVLVRIHTSGICGSQLGEIDGVKGPDRWLPHLLGHEGVGTVTALGDGVRHVREGQRVVLHWRPGAGIEAATPSYQWRGGKLNAGRVTTFNEYAVVSENRATPIPDDLDPAVGFLLGCAATTGFGVVTNDARVRPGESVVVLGCGGVGLAVVQAAALVSAHPIVAVDRTADKLALAARCGASRVVDARDGDLERAVGEILGRGADVVVESTGVPSLIRTACEIASPEGRVVLVGVPPHDARTEIDTLPLHFGLSLVGSHGGGSRPERDIPLCIGLYRSGKLALDALVTDHAPLGGINRAIERIRAGEVVGRCVIDIDRG